VSLVLSIVGGWSKLAQFYNSTDGIEGTEWRFQCASTRFGVKYNRCLNITANGEGIRITMLFLFRAGHPPLFIPWRDISVKQETSFHFWKYTRFVFRKVPEVPLSISNKLAAKIQQAAGEAWPGERNDFTVSR
jgi:hypothetical protein